MKNRGSDGVPVQFVDCATKKASRAGDDAIEGLVDGGWPYEAVALLTAY